MTVRPADFVTPPYEPVIVTVPGEYPVAVVVPDVPPAGIVTFESTSAIVGSELVSVTTAPPGGAGPVSVAVAVELSPTLIVAGLRVSDERAGAGVGVRVAVRVKVRVTVGVEVFVRVGVRVRVGVETPARLLLRLELLFAMFGSGPVPTTPTTFQMGFPADAVGLTVIVNVSELPVRFTG